LTSRKDLISFAILSMLLLALAAHVQAASGSVKVAVMPFTEGDIHHWYVNRRDMLEGITQLVTNKLVHIEGIRVIERSQIDEILKEQDFGASGRIDPSTAAEMGKILGVDAVVLGTLTQLDVEEVGGLSIGFLKVKGIKATVILTGRIVDTRTGEILASVSGRGKEMNASVSISDLKGLSFGSKAFKHSALGMAVEESTTMFVQDIEKNERNIQPASSGVITGKVLKVLGNKLIVNVGSNDGLKEKQIGKLIQVVEVEGLDEPVSVPVGKVHVLSVDDNAAVLVVTEKEEEPQKGYIVEFERN